MKTNDALTETVLRESASIPVRFATHFLDRLAFYGKRISFQCPLC